MEDKPSKTSKNIVINEAQLLLAEKRTSLAAMRTGIAIFALPLTVMSFLIVTSKYYDYLQVLHLLIPVSAICLLLAVLGTWLIIRAFFRIHKMDKVLHRLKQRNTLLSQLLD